MPNFFDRFIPERVTNFLRKTNLLPKRDSVDSTSEVPFTDFKDKETVVRVFQQVRDVVKDVLQAGSYGSDFDPSVDRQDKKPIYLGNLLSYKKNRPHAQSLARLLDLSENYPVITFEDYRRDKTEKDCLVLIHDSTSQSQSMFISDDALKDFSRSFIDRESGSMQPDLSILLGTSPYYSNENKLNTNFIDLNYVFSDYRLGNRQSADQSPVLWQKLIDQSIGRSAYTFFRFDIEFLNNFYLVPENPSSMNVENFLKNLLSPEVDEENKKSFFSFAEIKLEKKGEFWCLLLTLDMEGLLSSGEIEKKVSYTDLNQHMLQSIQRHSTDIKQTLFVCVGQTEIEGQKYWIWTGSESSKLSETDMQSIPDAQQVPSLGSLGRANA